jgi:hypothetical protein
VTQSYEDIERELRRVVDRLTTLSLDRLATCGPDCRRTADVLVAHTRALDPEVPVGAAVPDLGPQGLGAMLAVLGRDYLAVVDSDPEAGDVLAALVTLRRALP